MISKQWKKRGSLAYGFSAARLALNASTLVEKQPDVEDNAAMRPFYEEFLSLLREYLEGRADSAGVLDLRRRILEETELLMAYSDAFTIIDYVITREQLRFTGDASDGPDEKAFVTQVTRYLTSAQNSVTMNQRIQDVIGQLPVRMTRRKYYSLVQDGLSVYLGSSREGLNQKLYELQICGMMNLSEEKRAKWPGIDAFLSELSRTSYRDLSVEQFQTLLSGLLNQTVWLNEALDDCQRVMEMANDLYVLCLTRDVAVKDAANEAASLAVLNLCAQADGSCEIPDEKLIALEGLQETYYEKYLRLPSAPARQDGESEEAASARTVDILMSTSMFADLKGQPDLDVVTRADLDVALEAFVTVADRVFAKVTRPVTRAIMAKTLAALPVFFQSMEETLQYISTSLESCENWAEKDASMQMIQKQMENEGYEMV